MVLAPAAPCPLDASTQARPARTGGHAVLLRHRHTPPSSSTPEPVATKCPATQDAVKRAAFVRAVADVRAAMGQRNLAASKRSLQTAAANAQGPADQAELERLQALQDHLEQFWDGIRKAVAAMQPVDEIVLSESNRVAVIEASREELAVQWEGRPQRWRIEAIPMDLLMAIAKSSFKPTAGSKLIFGSFLAMDSLGDRARPTSSGKRRFAAVRAKGSCSCRN